MAVCFSCDRDIAEGELYFCVQRLRKVRESADPDEDGILDATASLQVCFSCMANRGRRIRFECLPLPVLNLEKNAMTELSQSLNAGHQVGKAETRSREHCSLCRTAIERWDVYTEVEVELDLQKSEGSVEALTVDVVATICEECTIEYLVWI